MRTPKIFIQLTDFQPILPTLMQNFHYDRTEMKVFYYFVVIKFRFVLIFYESPFMYASYFKVAYKQIKIIGFGPRIYKVFFSKAWFLNSD